MTIKATDQAKPLYVTRDFHDTGTGRKFKRAEVLKDCTEGEIGNYEAAGLASAEKPTDPKAADAA